MNKKVKSDHAPKCGIVMPISDCDGCSEDHWKEVRTLVTRSAVEAGFEAMLVSEADDVGVIQKRIVQNLYECPVAVCDVSGRNANVMFELGMRLAFDKPTVVIKDDKTPFSFDTSPVEHVTYPRDLRFSKMEVFQEQLVGKIKKSADGDGGDSFLKSFGSFKVADISVEKTPIDELLLEEILSLKRDIKNIRSSFYNTGVANNRNVLSHFANRSNYPVEKFVLGEMLSNRDDKRLDELAHHLTEFETVEETEFSRFGRHVELSVTFDGRAPEKLYREQLRRVAQLVDKYNS